MPLTGLPSIAIIDSTTAGRAVLTAANAAAQRTALSLGTAAVLDAGTSANNLVQLDGSARLPAVDGSQLTNLPSSGSGVPNFPFIGGGTKTPFGLYGWTTSGRAIGSNVANSNNLVVAMLHYHDGGRSIDGLSINVQTAADTTGQVRLALYDADGTDGAPGTLIQDAGTVSILSTGTKEASFTAINPPAGWYWAVMFTNVGGSTLPRLAAPSAMALGVSSFNIASNNAVNTSHLSASAYSYPGSAPNPAPALSGAQHGASTAGAFYICLELA